MTDTPFDPANRTLGTDRFLFRLGVDYLLRLIMRLSDLFGGDLMLTVTFLAVAQASVRHLNQQNQPNPLAVDGILPDGMRRPVTIATVARSLNLPRETARRYIRRLIDMGYCRQTGPRGVMVPSEVMRSEGLTAVALDNVMGLKLLYEGIERSRDGKAAG